MDDIGLGNAIANLIYLIIIAFGISGLVVLLKKKFFRGAFFWSSSILNLFFYFYLMGNYRFYPKMLYPIVNKYWPILNFLWLIFLIRNYLSIKNAKTKNK